MEYYRYQSSFGGANLGDVNATTLSDKKKWVAKSNRTTSTSNSYYEQNSPRRERYVVKSSTLSNKPQDTSWWNDPEVKRRRRVAKYKFYAAEGKFKHSVKKGFRWLKIRCIKIITKL